MRKRANLVLAVWINLNNNGTEEMKNKLKFYSKLSNRESNV